MAQMRTHRLAQTLETLSQILRELPDQGLHTLLQQPRPIHEERKRRRESHLSRPLPPPPRSPREMDRHELEAYLQSPACFPHKADLLEFARRYKVPVDARTSREEMIRLCLRIIYDIPKGLANLRLMSKWYDSPPAGPASPFWPKGERVY